MNQLRSILACLGMLAMLWPSVAAEETALQVRITAEFESPPQRFLDVRDEYVAAFGRKVELRGIRIDQKTRGVADCFVWIRQPRQRNASDKPTIRTVFLADGQYHPYSAVYSYNDLLQVRSFDAVGDIPRASFPETVNSNRVNGSGPVEFRLHNTQCDKPAVVDSSNHPWLSSYFFVERETTCVVTDRLGECRLPVTIRNSERVQILLWHPNISPERFSAPADSDLTFTKSRCGQFAIAEAKGDSITVRVRK